MYIFQKNILGVLDLKKKKTGTNQNHVSQYSIYL